MADRDSIAEPDWTTVRRVEDETGSHVEPPFDEMWPDLWKLRWLAASVGAAIGTEIHVGEDTKHGGPYRFGISYRYSDIDGTPVGVGTSQSRSVDGMWTYLTGMESGHRIAAGRIAELERQSGHSVIETREELDTLDWPCLVREITPEDELEFYPQIWERAFQTDGWNRAGQMFDEQDCTPRLPVEVLPEPKEASRG
ncbi:hypothetical protein [Nocardia sp. NPDC059228]|uniref:hypothetical protein n=1 Tax=Nocardia sp. NPDC059228 TaxID=3346777 RepID=UPI0036C86E78